MSKDKCPRGERGIAMMMCLFALLLLTTIAMGLMFMANTETTVNANYRVATQAFYGSKAGLEEARERLRFGNSYSITPPMGIPSASNPNGILYILNTQSVSNDSVAPWIGSTANRYMDDEMCNEPFFTSSDNSLFSGFTPTIGVPCDINHVPPSGSYSSFTSFDPGYDSPAAMGYKWVRITAKQDCTTTYGVSGNVGPACFISTNSTRDRQVCADPNDLVNGAPREILMPAGGVACESVNPPLRSVYVITSMASSVRGPHRMTQYEVASVTVPPFPAGIMLDGSLPVVSLPDFNTNTFDGNDHAAGAGCTAGAPVVAIGVVDNDSLTIVKPLPLLRPTQYLGLGASAGVPSVGIVALNSVYNSVSNLQALVGAIGAGADQSFGNNPSGVVLGTDANPKVTYVNGDFTMDGNHGAGLLLVTGNLTIAANPDFNGTILVIGKGSVTITTNTNTATFKGNMLIAKIYDSSGNLLGAPGAPTLNWGPAGVSALQYDSCWVTRVASRLGYKVIADREEMY